LTGLPSDRAKIVRAGLRCEGEGEELILRPSGRRLVAARLLTPSLAAHSLGAKRLFPARLGGGAFGNPAHWITAAMAGAIDSWQAADMEVVIASHGRPGLANRPLLDRFVT
jgi:hypothetical protein